jgi:hypothetical protein
MLRVLGNSHAGPDHCFQRRVEAFDALPPTNLLKYRIEDPDAFPEVVQ